MIPDDTNIQKFSKYDEITNICLRKTFLAIGEFWEYTIARCLQNGCQTFQSMGKNNVFFTFTDLNNLYHSNSSLRQILEIVFDWINDFPINVVCQLMGGSF